MDTTWWDARRTHPETRRPSFPESLLGYSSWEIAALVMTAVSRQARVHEPSPLGE